MVASHFAGLELAQPRLDVAAQRHDAQVGARALGDRLPAQRGGAERRALRQLGERARLAADEHVARVFALEAGRQHQPGRQHGRHVLGRMHGEIDAAVEQRFLDLLGEQALAADLRQRPVLDGVAGGADDDELDRRLVHPERRGQPRAHGARLHQRQRAAARADAQGGGRIASYYLAMLGHLLVHIITRRKRERPK